jgi:hypothetical protein
LRQDLKLICEEEEVTIELFNLYCYEMHGEPVTVDAMEIPHVCTLVACVCP